MDATFDEIAKAVTRTVKVEFHKPQPVGASVRYQGRESRYQRSSLGTLAYKPLPLPTGCLLTSGRGI